MQINTEQEITEKKELAVLILDFVLICVTVVFHLFGFIPLIPSVDKRVISHNILIQSLFQQEGAQICFKAENWVSCKAQQSPPRYDFFITVNKL